jgi:hypothetical protein
VFRLPHACSSNLGLGFFLNCFFSCQLPPALSALQFSRKKRKSTSGWKTLAKSVQNEYKFSRASDIIQIAKSWVKAIRCLVSRTQSAALPEMTYFDLIYFGRLCGNITAGDIVVMKRQIWGPGKALLRSKEPVLAIYEMDEWQDLEVRRVLFMTTEMWHDVRVNNNNNNRTRTRTKQIVYVVLWCDRE